MQQPVNLGHDPILRHASEPAIHHQRLLTCHLVYEGVSLGAVSHTLLNLWVTKQFLKIYTRFLGILNVMYSKFVYACKVVLYINEMYDNDCNQYPIQRLVAKHMITLSVSI